MRHLRQPGAGLCNKLDASAMDDLLAEPQRAGDKATRALSIIEGVVKLSRLLADGKQQVVGFRFAGDVLLGCGARPFRRNFPCR